MISMILTLATLLLNPVSADARSPERMNYEGCNASRGTRHAGAPRINDRGNFEVNTRNKIVLGHEKDAEKETLKTIDVSEFGEQDKMQTTTYSMSKKDGIPQNMVIRTGNLGRRGNNGRFSADFYEEREFDFKDNNCFVSRISSHAGANGEEVIAYDRGLCDNLLRSAKRMGGVDQLNKCTDELQKMNKSILAFTRKAEKEGKKFCPFLGGCNGLENGPFNKWAEKENSNSALVAGLCAGSRASFESDRFTPDTQMFGARGGEVDEQGNWIEGERNRRKNKAGN